MSTGCFEMGESSFYSGTAYQFPFIIDKNRDCPNLTRGNWVTSIHQQNDSNNSPLYTRRTFGSTPESFGSTCGHGSTQAIDSTYTLDSAHIFCSPNNGNSIRKTITDVNSNNVNYKVPKLQLFVPLPPLQTVVSDDLFCITQPYPRNIPPTDIEPYQYTDAVFPRARISEQLYIPFPGEYEEEKEQHERVKEWEHVEILSNSRNFKRQPIINDHARMKPFVNKTRKHRTSPKSKSCEKCGSSETPEWRSGPIGRGTLCNACGLKWKKMCKMGVGYEGFNQWKVNHDIRESKKRRKYDKVLDIPLVLKLPSLPLISNGIIVS